MLMNKENSNESDLVNACSEWKAEIKIEKHPNNIIFFDDWIETSLVIRLNEERTLKDEALVLKSDLCYYEDGKMKTVNSDSHEVVFDVTELKTCSFDEGPKKVKMCFKVSPGLDSKIYYFIQPFLVLKGMNNCKEKVAETKTNSFKLITYKLGIVPIDWEDIWYKDEGGRDKCMQVQVGLMNHKNEFVQSRRVQLKLTLMYESNDGDVAHSIVMKQDILNVFGAPRHFIDTETAKTFLRFRIEDVSKNHQGQGFIVQIKADTSKGTNDDIAPSFTPSVSVRSKRNKRQRTTKDGSTSQYSYEPLNSPSGNSSHKFVSHPANVGAAAGIPATPIASQITRQAHMQSSSGNHDGFEGIDDISSLREAMRGVIRWTEEVINGLYPLQWQVIGYAQYPDGTLDYNRPYHSMPNPNARISKVLSMYSENTREQLRVLLDAVENTNLSRVNTGNDSRLDKSFTNATQGLLLPNTLPQQIPDAKNLNRHVNNINHSSLSTIDASERDDIKSEIEYVLAIQYKSSVTGYFHGFPTYNERHELLGFYEESRNNVGLAKFVPLTSISNKDLTPVEVSQVTSLLLDAMKNNRESVYALKDWGTLSNLFDHVMIYEWSSKGRVANGWWCKDTE